MEIRSTKLEIRNNIKVLMFKIQNGYPEKRCFEHFNLLSFKFFSYFDIRISDF